VRRVEGAATELEELSCLQADSIRTYVR
jgi:hypothetical protein